MMKIEFETPFGDETKKIKLVSNDYGGGGYQILINNYYDGEIFWRDGTWQAHLSPKTILTGDDITILGEIIERGVH